MPSRPVLRAAIAGLVMLSAVSLAVPALAAWTDNNCSGESWEISVWKRSQARNYAEKGDKEGYEWGGGCYKLNDKDDTPFEPDSGGEGADCSGYVFKTWALRNSFGADGFRFWEHEKEVHGPYSSGDFYSPCSGCPFRLLKDKRYTTTTYMDAFVYRSGGNGHIGMIYSEGSGGFDWIVEAKSDADGTRIAWTDYRAQSAYRPVARKAWTPECWPYCPR